jgi:hypothetical protein
VYAKSRLRAPVSNSQIVPDPDVIHCPRSM